MTVILSSGVGDNNDPALSQIAGERCALQQLLQGAVDAVFTLHCCGLVGVYQVVGKQQLVAGLFGQLA